MHSRHIQVQYRPLHYSVDEWYCHNREQYWTTKDRGITAEKLIEKSGRIQDRVKELIIKNKRETEWLFKGRIKDIEFIRVELENVRKSVQEELEELEILQERIQDEIKCVKANAGEIVEKCIQIRKGRLGRDLIHDEVERELEIEKKKIAEAGVLLEKALEHTKEFRRDLRASIYLLNKDVKDKLDCIAIELECLNLKETDSNISVCTEDKRLDNGNVSVEEWACYSDKIIKSSEKKIKAARSFEVHVKILLGEIMNDLSEQYFVVNKVFQSRIEEVKEAKTKLEEQHYEIARQLNIMKQNISQLTKSIEEKAKFLALAQTRLEKRSNRPGVELVKDKVEASLVGEILEIKDSVSNLEKMHSEAEQSLRCLLEAQIRLEQEINIKNNSIKIDEVDCLTIRQSIDYHSF